MFTKELTIYILVAIAVSLLCFYAVSEDKNVTNNQLSKQIEILTEKVNHLEKLLDGLSKKE